MLVIPHLTAFLHLPHLTGVQSYLFCVLDSFFDLFLSLPLHHLWLS